MSSAQVQQPPPAHDASSASHILGKDSRVYPSGSYSEAVAESQNQSTDNNGSANNSSDHDEGVEVVLECGNKTTVVDVSPASSTRHDQNVFRAPYPVRPRAVRGGRPPPVHTSGSFGYNPHYGGSHHGDYHRHHQYGHGNGPYPISYAPTGSFDHQDGSGYPGPPTTTSQYSPHVQYPPVATRRPEDVNVISPSHKDHHHQHSQAHPHHGQAAVRGPGSGYAPSSGAYAYPPQSPVSRPGGPAAATPPRMRGYGRHGYPPPDRSRPPLVAVSSFDSDYYSSHASHSSSHPATPNAPHHGPPGGAAAAAHHGQHHDPHYGYGATSFEGSFDSHRGGVHPGYYDERSSSHFQSPPHPYSEHSPHLSHSHGYSPSGGSHYDPYSPYGGHYGRYPPRSYDEHERYYYPYGHPEYDHGVKKDEKSGMILPKAASEVDFEITDPPMEPITPASTQPVCESPGDVNSYDVLCGRGGGTNSQVGNRRFRKLVQEFQPIYLLARRKEKPLLARTIVLIIRKRGGRFLKKDEETGELYEVGDAKAEAKTSQALREGLDVRATKSAASSLMDKKKKKSTKSSSADDSELSPNSAAAGNDEPSASPSSEVEEKSPTKKQEEDTYSPEQPKSSSPAPSKGRAESPPSLPKLHGEHCESGSSKAAAEAPPTPDQMLYRKRRRMRSADGDVTNTSGGCDVNPFSGDKLFPDFCPPRADLARTASPTPRVDDSMDMGMTPIPAQGVKYEDDDIRYEQDTPATASGCAGIALDMVTGAAAGSFCLGPRQWR